jgi:hypothetical protein
MVRRLLATDVAVAVALCAFMVPVSAIVRTTQPAARGLSTVGVALLALSGLVLALRRVRPYLAFTVSVAAAAAYLALRYPGWPVYLGAVVALISLVSQARDRRWIPFAAIGGGAVAVATGPPENWDIARMVTVVVVWCAVAGFVRCVEGWLEIEVRDDGVAAPTAAAGHGIRGMTERASGVGGVLTAGPDPERGFVVRARLPLRSRP